LFIYSLFKCKYMYIGNKGYLWNIIQYKSYIYIYLFKFQFQHLFNISNSISGNLNSFNSNSGLQQQFQMELDPNLASTCSRWGLFDCTFNRVESNSDWAISFRYFEIFQFQSFESSNSDNLKTFNSNYRSFPNIQLKLWNFL